MKIGVISDTHSHPIPPQVLDDFKDVEFILHAGDFCSLADLKTLTRIKDVKGVWGNMDDPDIRRTFPEKQLIRVGAVTIGMYHGDGPPQKLLEVIRAQFKKDRPQVVVYGHSHHPFNESLDGVLYFNPGSPNDKIFAPYPSYGLLEIDADKVSGKIIKVKG